MANVVYVDTNVVIDIVDSARPLHRQSMEQIAHYMETDSEMAINSDTLSNLFYILTTRSTLDYADILTKMRLVEEVFTLIPITSTDVRDVLDLCEADATPFKDYEDTMQYICAQKAGAASIITNDKTFVSPDISVESTD